MDGGVPEEGGGIEKNDRLEPGVSPAYLALYERGELAARAQRAYQRLSCCDLCAHACRADRLSGGCGRCLAGAEALVSSYGPHFGEEDVLVGRRGSGTVFFAGCNLGCVFCQNWEISHGREGRLATPEELSGIFLALQDRGCHNLNLVTPTPHLPAILAALALACAAGLRLPLVWNCGGYESPTALALLDGVVDIYMPDFKFGEDEAGRALAGAPGYFAAAGEAIREMHRQVGDLRIDADGIARRGLLVRHLVLPGNLAGSERVLRFLADLSPDTYVNIMDQYHPAWRAREHPPLDRGITAAEYREAVGMAEEAGLRRIAE